MTKGSKDSRWGQSEAKMYSSARSSSGSAGEDDDVDEQKKIDGEINELPTLDQLDFKLREALHSCVRCQKIKGHRDATALAKDPKIYDFLVKYRAMFKKDRIRAEDLQDDVCSLEVNKKNQNSRLSSV